MTTSEVIETAPDPSPRRSTLDRLARPALALGGGAVVALSLPPWGFWPLAFVGIAVFDLCLDGASTGARARRGWLFGAGWMFLGMGWMIQLTGPGYVAASAIFASFHAGAAAVASVAGPGRWGVVSRPVAHTLVEALRLSFPFGGVPLATLGISQVGGPLGGVARVGGVVLLTWVTFQLGFAIVPTLRRVAAQARRSSSASADTSGHDRGEPFSAGRQPPPTRQLTIALGLAAITVAVSTVAPRGSDTGETMRIAAVQGGGEQGTSALDVPSIVVTERHLDATERIEPDPELDLVFWPENTIDVVTFEDSDVVPLIVAQARRLGVPIAVGLTEDVRVDGVRRFTNAQVVVTPDGEMFSRYDKVRRVPFGEYVPLRSIIEQVTSAIDRVGDAVPGTTPALLELPDGQRLATVISWEVFFGGRAREGVELGGQIVLNPTNGASYTGTIVQTQQVASSRLRAIETGRWVVQAAPTGFSAFISPDGDVVERTSQREQTVITRDVALRRGDTWYTSLGDGPFIVALVIALIAVAVTSRRSGSPARR